MTPQEKAREMYHCHGQSFEEVVTRYLMHHYMYSDPKCFILAKPIDDYWFVECAIGKGCLARFLELMPFPLPKVAFARGLRGGPLKFYPTERVKELV
jgi:hypothetical protein